MIDPELGKALEKARSAVSELIKFFPQATTEDAELDLVVEAGVALDRLADCLKTRKTTTGG